MALDSSMPILLVEDAGTMRKMEIKILNGLGFTSIQEAVDGNDAIDKLNANPGIRLVISDWSMPNKDGLELLQWMRSSEAFQALPFLMATGQGDKQHVAKAMEAGASGVVAKPFSPDELKTTIEEAFGVKQASAAEPARGLVTTADGRSLLRVAHIQITDHLALGVLKHQLESGQKRPTSFSLETRCMPNWNLLQAALEKGDVDAAFILAPAAMDLFNYGVPIRLVLFAHRDGSIMVRNRVGDYRKPYQQFFKHKTFYIPYKMSIHNMLAHKYFTEMGLKPGVAGKEAVNVLFDVVAPINMPEFLAENPSTCGFMVAEPIGSRAIAAGIAERLFLSSEMWENHPCCVVVFRDDFIGKNPDAVHEFTDLLVDAGRSIQKNPDSAAEIAVGFLDPQKKLGLSTDLLRNVLTDPKGIKTSHLYPVREDLDVIQRYMYERMGIGAIIDLEKFVDTRFADVTFRGISDEERRGTVTQGAITVETGAEAAGPAAPTHHKLLRETQVSREGKYLIFNLAGERYGVSVLDIREIIQARPITSIPRMPHFIKGIINLRNRVIPILDMRLKFDMPAAEYHERMCFVIVEIAGRTGSTLLGIVVDAVLEVADIREDIIQNTPDFGSQLNANFIIGMARMQSGVTMLLDIEKVLTTQEVGFLDKAAITPAPEHD